MECWAQISPLIQEKQGFLTPDSLSLLWAVRFKVRSLGVEGKERVKVEGCDFFFL